jgi:hypothetical protein
MKLAVNSWAGRCLQVWDVHGQKSNVRRGKRSASGPTRYAPVFWTTRDATIIAAFSIIDDPDSDFCQAMIIYEFDASTLETVGTPFEGHPVISLV